MNDIPVFHIQQQRGAVLIMSLFFLVITAMITSNVVHTSVMETKMVGNAQFKEEAAQINEGVINAITANYANNLPVVGDIGYVVCAQGVVSNDCDTSIINISSSLTTVASGVNLTYKAMRLGPLLGPLPFREAESQASGVGNFNVAIYDIESEYDGRDVKLGHHKLHQGLAIKLAAFGQ